MLTWQQSVRLSIFLQLLPDQFFRKLNLSTRDLTASSDSTCFGRSSTCWQSISAWKVVIFSDEESKIWELQEFLHISGRDCVRYSEGSKIYLEKQIVLAEGSILAISSSKKNIAFSFSVFAHQLLFRFWQAGHQNDWSTSLLQLYTNFVGFWTGCGARHFLFPLHPKHQRFLSSNIFVQEVLLFRFL
jgi:hypothetical protein